MRNGGKSIKKEDRGKIRKRKHQIMYSKYHFSLRVYTRTYYFAETSVVAVVWEKFHERAAHRDEEGGKMRVRKSLQATIDGVS